MSPGKVQRQLAEEPRSLWGEQYRGRARKGDPKVLSKEARWEQGQCQKGAA